MEQEYGKKRPLWQWVLLYLIIGLIIYGVVYYFFIAKKGSGSYTSQTTYPQQASPSAQVPLSTIVTTRTDTVKGNYLADAKGMSLYTYDKDTRGTSNCTGACLSAWPAYMAVNPAKILPTQIFLIKRSGGSTQYAWNGAPLYYYAKDQKPGDILGDGVGGVWHLIKMP